MSAPKAGPSKAESFPDGTSDYVPLRGKSYDINKTHITEMPMTLGNWYKHINWLNCVFVLFIPLAGLIATYWVPAQWKTILFSVVRICLLHHFLLPVLT